ncbi:MAG TPA: class I SAM-dependent methyltransferase [Longimicrobiales bacterium]|nr:class I SAM-dependent methyltransferase [Longimicrobiales bacterium]
MERRDHWEAVYTTKTSDEMSWFQARPERSLDLIRNTGVGRDAGVIDVGGGDSRLVDVLVDEGYVDLTVLDVSAAALARARERLGAAAAAVTWITGDVTRFEPRRTWDVWHDRAVFHFLTDPHDRAAYRNALLRALAPGGHVVLATFAPDGPARCSGLDVVRYGPDDLLTALGHDFTLLAGEGHLHSTPSGATQSFTYAHLQRRRS